MSTVCITMREALAAGDALAWLVEGAGRRRCPDKVYHQAHLALSAVRAAVRGAEDQVGPASVLPLRVVDSTGKLIGATVCDSIRFAPRTENSMPPSLTLMRIRDGEVYRAEYHQSALLEATAQPGAAALLEALET